MNHIYHLSESYLRSLRQNQKQNQNIFDYLPKFAINNNGKLIDAEYYHQFTGFGDFGDEKFYFLDISTLDSSLNNDFSDLTINEVFGNLDFLKYIHFFDVNTEKDLSNFVLPNTHYLIIETTYNGGYDSCTGDSDFNADYNIIGYLNKNMDKILF